MENLQFKEAVISMYGKLTHFALTLTCNAEEAKDLVQETYLKVLSSEDKYEKDTNLKAWMLTIMRNTFINDYRKRKRVNEVINENIDISSLGQYALQSPEQADINYYVKEINRHINNIEEDQRIPFEMFLDGYKYKEIADEMDISLGTVKSRIFFTRKKLQNTLADYIH
ncbi:MAG: sigma-70 family RNA polymerase sigma factor [Bacteroidales bacterium]|jgi:RNA polymerase sigma-70 factor (ECF subfamily)|nr:sigma-70 family RNA polymerase sigma factor [Bacteroidales bacterium]